MPSSTLLTDAIVRSQIQKIWDLALPVTKLTATGNLKRYGRIWYLDIVYNAPVPTPNLLLLTTNPTGSLLLNLQTLQGIAAAIKADRQRNLSELKARLDRIELTISQLNRQLALVKIKAICKLKATVTVNNDLTLSASLILPVKLTARLEIGTMTVVNFTVNPIITTVDTADYLPTTAKAVVSFTVNPNTTTTTTTAKAVVSFAVNPNITTTTTTTG